MTDNIITALVALAGLFSACCLNSEHIGPFLIVCVLSALWCFGYAIRHGYIYTE